MSSNTDRASTAAVDRPSWLNTWWIAVRPFSFPASSMSVVFGTVLAVTLGGAKLDWPLFIASVVAMMVLHAGANVLNDVYDYRKGLDTTVLPVSGAVVRGLLTPKRALRGAVVMFVVGSLLGGYVALRVGWPVVWIGFAGVLIGVAYSATPAGLKYHALGDVAVFLNFGILGSLGAWTAQTRAVAWLPVLWAIPLSILVVAILHANNWRDIRGDTDKGCSTIASKLGDKGSLGYYGFLLFAPFLITVGYVVIPRLAGSSLAMPLSFLITLLALPLAVRLLVRGKRRATPRNPLDFVALDGATAQLNLAFGVLCTAALLLHAWLA